MEDSLMALTLSQSIVIVFVVGVQAAIAATQQSALAALTMAVTAVVATLALVDVIAIETAIVLAALAFGGLSLALILAWRPV